jgi:hypothetical protein
MQEARLCAFLMRAQAISAIARLYASLAFAIHAARRLRPRTVFVMILAHPASADLSRCRALHFDRDVPERPLHGAGGAIVVVVLLAVVAPAVLVAFTSQAIA